MENDLINSVDEMESKLKGYLSSDTLLNEVLLWLDYNTKKRMFEDLNDSLLGDLEEGLE